MTKINASIVFSIHAIQAGGMERVMVEVANYISENKPVNVHLVLFGKS